MSAIPFLRPGAPDDVIAWRGSETITRERFFRDVAALGVRLPPQPWVLNHCDDRYHFAVGFAAALLRGQVSLFPSSRSPDALARLAAAYPRAYCLTDRTDPEEAAVLETMAYDTGSSPALPADPVFDGAQLATILFTSGSTGGPTPHAKTWQMLVDETQLAFAALGFDRRLPRFNLATVPSQHLYGLLFAVLGPLRWGQALGAERPFFPQDIRRGLLRQPGDTMLVTTPLSLRACVRDHDPMPPAGLLLSSTAALDSVLAREAEARFRAPLHEIYGSTETGAIATRRQNEGESWRLFSGVRLAPNDDGLIVTAGHLPAPVVVSDRIELRGAGRFVLLGRSSELIKIAGKRIALGELNRLLLATEGVRDGTFFLPEAEAGDEPRLAAFVVAPGRTRAAILDALREHLDPVFLPRPLHLVSELPRNATGKLVRSELMRLYFCPPAA
jgi:acyl-coenzyme A synthetase/AMP-(fatty) acid ligase